MQSRKNPNWNDNDYFEDCDIPEEAPVITKKIESSKDCHKSLLSSNKGGLKEEDRTEFITNLEIEYTNRSLSPTKFRSRWFVSEKEIPIFSIAPTTIEKKSVKKRSPRRFKKKGKRKSLKKRRYKRSISIITPCKTKSSSNTIGSGEGQGKKAEKSMVERMAKHQSMKLAALERENFGLQLTIGDISPA
ncbi:unnamed protein product [Moneuplotes crassus]|uniref:Uncharacterized protein n=1 Tax=Euplotes crassus TaxID=5936 RepID=A0AAD1X477_EUPCR|nr:unnamed protein product [Moneuplotes crassus]